jgi:cytochrome c oxidase accessory protein FixG
LLVVFFGGPLVHIHGHPLFLINVFERQFVLFGIPFWPQDFHLVALAMITFVVFIVLFTVVFGRVWCGWACPQTIFLEMVFRKIEYWIEGDAGKQRKLARSAWNAEKVLKKGAKHLIFIIISLLISHTVMAYLIGIDQVIEIVSQPPTEHITGFLGLMAFTLIFYFVFSWFREQACIAVCPYGRLQGVFLGNNSIAVMYDWVRGEPRKRLKKNDSFGPDRGDCIDCKHCVHVCPTGIDIRNGTQLECVNCTACMDACDDIMVKINRPKGLIKYASHNGVKTGNHKLFTPRVLGYSAILLVLISAITLLLSTRSDIEVTVLKVPGQLYQKQDNNRISNLYNIQFINKTYEPYLLDLRVANIDNATIKRVGESALNVPASGTLDGVFFVEIPQESLEAAKTKILIELLHEGEVIDEVKTTFIGPINYGR